MVNTSDGFNSTIILTMSNNRKDILDVKHCYSNPGLLEDTPVTVMITDFKQFIRFHEITFEKNGSLDDFRITAYSISSDNLNRNKLLTRNSYIRLFYILTRNYVDNASTWNSNKEQPVNNADYIGVDEYCIRRLTLKQNLKLNGKMKLKSTFPGRLLVVIFTSMKHKQKLCMQHSIRYTVLVNHI